jgi:integrase
MKKRFTDADVAALVPTKQRYTERDPELASHYIRVSSGGAKSFWTCARNKAGDQVWQRIGSTAELTIEESRIKALGIINSIRNTDGGADAPRSSFAGVADDWWKRHVVGNGIIRSACTRTHLSRAKAALGETPFIRVTRTQISELLDKVEDEHGKTSADALLRVLASLCNWYATRHGSYTSPIVRGMRRSKDVACTRTLNEDELRQLWAIGGKFGSFTKLALLTAQRKEKIAGMRWQDVRNGVWRIPTKPREKGVPALLVLPQAALDVLSEIPQQGEYVFGAASLRNYLQRSKDEFDAERNWADWVIHDLRRTSRSLMAKAGIVPIVAEAILGHKQGGVAGTYDQHKYQDEMTDALKVLASRLRDITTPPADNVVDVDKRKRKRAA